MPFYVLHQPVIIAIGYGIYALDWPLWVKLLLLVPASFVIITGLYHLVIRKSNVLRVLFGLRAEHRVQDSGA